MAGGVRTADDEKQDYTAPVLVCVCVCVFCARVGFWLADDSLFISSCNLRVCLSVEIRSKDRSESGRTKAIAA
jgi:hypothetical protein